MYIRLVHFADLPTEATKSSNAKDADKGKVPTSSSSKAPTSSSSKAPTSSSSKALTISSSKAPDDDIVGNMEAQTDSKRSAMHVHVPTHAHTLSVHNT